MSILHAVSWCGHISAHAMKWTVLFTTTPTMPKSPYHCTGSTQKHPVREVVSIEM